MIGSSALTIFLARWSVGRHLRLLQSPAQSGHLFWIEVSKFVGNITSALDTGSEIIGSGLVVGTK